MEQPEDIKLRDLAEFLEGKDKDWFLHSLVVISNLGLSVGITLNVGGAVISGTMISGKTYFEKLSKLIGSGTGDDRLRTVLSEAIAQNVAVYDDKEEDSEPAVSYIHLEDARCYYPNGNLPTNEGVLWRGKLTSIDGFFMGNLKGN